MLFILASGAIHAEILQKIVSNCKHRKHSFCKVDTWTAPRLRIVNGKGGGNFILPVLL